MVISSGVRNLCFPVLGCVRCILKQRSLPCGRDDGGVFFRSFCFLFLGFIISLFFTVSPAAAQELHGIPLLDSLLAGEHYPAADSALQSQIQLLKKAGETDSLAHYPYYVGTVARQIRDLKYGVQKAEEFVEILKKKKTAAKSMRQAYLELGTFYGSVGMLTKAYKSNEQALVYTQKMPDRTGENIGLIENNLGGLDRRRGNISQSIIHHRRALHYFNKYPQTQKENLYITYNNMGAMMWFSSKADSALYYYDKALEMLQEMKPTPMNRYFRPANVLGNKAGLYSIAGETTQSLQMLDLAVRDYKKFIESKPSDVNLNEARKNLFHTIDNMAATYKELGNFTKARDLLAYSYGQKRTYLQAGSPELFKAQVLLGQTELSLKNYKKSLEYLNEGIRNFKKFKNDYLFWQADAYYSKALLYDEIHRPEKAAPLFEQSQTMLEKAYGESYDAYYLEFLGNVALFYAEHGNETLSLRNARKALAYVREKQGSNTLTTFKQQLNIASVYYKLGKYRRALNQSRKSLAILQKQNFKREHAIDSIQVEFKKPEALLLQAQSQYQLKSVRDTTFLITLMNQLDEAIDIVEKRKSILSSPEDLQVQVADNQDLLAFAQKIALELYQKTGNEKYLDRTIGLHESGVYNRIRARLNARRAMKFADVPDSIRMKEKELKEDISHKLKEQNISGYVESSASWQAFLKDLKAHYPRYFALRYGSVQPSLSEITKAIPEHTTLVRYFFVDKKLYALVLSQHKKQLLPLNYFSVNKPIRLLHQYAFDAVKTGNILHDLYQQLWKPFEKQVATKRVVIIPDGELFNLSFETLLSKPIQKFAEFSKKSLLAQYAISYRYSLSLLDEASSPAIKHDFIAFAPGFNEDMKYHYKKVVSDPLMLDHTYLTLLPQPFMVDLVVKWKHYFGGRIFTGEQSTEQKFISEAGNHNIIHIGTHAESNNLSPELSRLFFAKGVADTTLEDDNSLYAYQIYNYDLSSNLTLLTACETGKPQYQPGEGMISLAHAFSYAGSKSLLTSLWNIDEKTSSQIVDLFYQNLSKGMTKDVALQQAKLSYLTVAEGRTASPEYWAGLVMLGNASSISLQKAAPLWPWLLGLLLLVIAAGYFWMNRK